MTNPKISVILSAYNEEKFISKAIESVVNQTLKDIEIIIINDGSTDNTLDIINSYAEKDNRPGKHWPWRKQKQGHENS